MSRKVLRMAPYAIDYGIRSEDSEHGLLGQNPLWVVTEFPTEFRVPIAANDYPVCWTGDSMMKYLDAFFPIRDEVVLFEPDMYFSKFQSIIRPPRVIICSGSSSNVVKLLMDSIIEISESVFQRERITILRLEQGGFITAGMPISNTAWTTVYTYTTLENEEIITEFEYPYINETLFTGGEVLVIYASNACYNEYGYQPLEIYEEEGQDPIDRPAPRIEVSTPSMQHSINEASKCYSKFEKYHCIVLQVDLFDADPEIEEFEAQLYESIREASAIVTSNVSPQYYSYFVWDLAYDEDNPGSPDYAAFVEQRRPYIYERILNFFNIG